LRVEIEKTEETENFFEWLSKNYKKSEDIVLLSYFYYKNKHYARKYCKVGIQTAVKITKKFRKLPASEKAKIISRWLESYLEYKGLDSSYAGKVLGGVRELVDNPASYIKKTIYCYKIKDYKGLVGLGSCFIPRSKYHLFNNWCYIFSNDALVRKLFVGKSVQDFVNVFVRYPKPLRILRKVWVPDLMTYLAYFLEGERDCCFRKLAKMRRDSYRHLKYGTHFSVCEFIVWCLVVVLAWDSLKVDDVYAVFESLNGNRKV